MTKLEQLICDLNDALEYMQRYRDVSDSGDGRRQPNDAMKACDLIAGAIDVLNKEGHI